MGEQRDPAREERQYRHPNSRHGGQLWLFRCFACSERGTENHVSVIPTGVCATCGWKEGDSIYARTRRSGRVAEHLIALWLRSDENPDKIDWQTLLPKGITLEHADVQTFPWRDVQHEIRWWITRRLTAEGWGDLDNAESEVLGRIVGDHFAGTAGPIPEELEPDAEPPSGIR